MSSYIFTLKTDTPGCHHKKLTIFTKLAEEFGKYDTVVIGVAKTL